nr:MFS transporter [Thermococcus sp. LS1]
MGFFLFEVPTGVVADKVSRKTSVLIGMALFSLSVLFLIFLQNFPMLVAYAVLASLGATFVNTAFSFNFSVEFQHRIPSEKRATIVSLDMMFSALFMSAFYVLYGFAVQRLGLNAARLLFALIPLGVGFAFKAAQLLGPLRDPLRLRHLSKE